MVLAVVLFTAAIGLAETAVEENRCAIYWEKEARRPVTHPNLRIISFLAWRFHYAHLVRIPWLLLGAGACWVGSAAVWFLPRKGWRTKENQQLFCWRRVTA